MFQKDIFKDKIVLVTGGGTGIGFTIAEMFLNYGASVVIASRKQEKLDKAQVKLSELGTCKTFALDIRDLESVEKLAKFIKTEFGQLDILINNAGGQFPSLAEAIKPKGWKAVVETNLNGTWFVTQTMFNELFKIQENGIVVNIIVDIYRGFPGMSHTGAARAGVDNLTKSLAVEWAKHNLRINAVAPGIIKSTGLKNYPPAILEGISKNIPMKRLGTTTEVANLVLFLASPMASYMTGETVYVDGGSKLWGNFWQ